MPKFMSNRLVAAGAIAALSLVAVSSVYAQSDATSAADAAYWFGRSKASLATCPQLEWNVIPVPRGKPGEIKGVAFYHDMSGISVIKGTMSADGKVTATLTSVAGTGPSGTVTGDRGPDITHIEVHGTGCANMAFNLPRWGAAGGGGD